MAITKSLGLGNLTTGWVGDWLCVWGVTFDPVCVKNGEIVLMVEALSGPNSQELDRAEYNRTKHRTQILRTVGVGASLPGEPNTEDWILIPSDDEFVYFHYVGDELYSMEPDQGEDPVYPSELIIGGVFHPEGASGMVGDIDL